MRPARAALAAQVALLALLSAATGVGVVAWLVALGLQAIVVALLARGLAAAGTTALGAANLVTLVRSVLTCAVAGLVVASLAEPGPSAAIVALAAPALVLDAVDGRVARRTRTATPLGALFDMETDALLILALSVDAATRVGWWVLLIGLARYLLLLAQRVVAPLRGEIAPRRWRKAVAALQGVALLAVCSGLLPGAAATGLLAVALGALLLSFGTEVVERCGGRGAVRALVTVLAGVLVWAALAAPDGDRNLTPWLVLRVPLEGMVLVVVAALLPARWAVRLGAAVGVLLAVVVPLKAVNVGFTLVLDRRFDVIGDWFYLGAALGVLADSTGRAVAVLLVAVVVALVLALLVLLPIATVRVARAAGRHRTRVVAVAAALTVGAAALSAAGVGPAPYHRSLTAASAGVVVDQAVGVRADLRDHGVFAAEISEDPMARVPPERLLSRLRGVDVLLVFVESYGRSALEDPELAPAVTAAVEAGDRRLRRAGYRARSGFLTSPTFGAASWLAHATLQSGLWVDGQRRYSQLLGSDRLTLTGAFGRAGWRTVFAVPSVTRGWTEGERFYGFDRLYGAGDVGYRGPAFGYATMPDQYTLARFGATELAPTDRPSVMAEIDLVSSHHPWAPLPRLVPWEEVGDGSVFDPMPAEGESAEEVLADPDRVRDAYARSVAYSVEAVTSFLAGRPADDLVVVMLGDHQPHHYVSGEDPGYDVPVSVIARDPRLLSAVAGWRWSAGLRPATDAPVWRMDAFRDRFLRAFGTGPVHRRER
ncbi:CDP-alcohol phosphatidyltransferase family protein [Nocardioides sp. YIM 152588]|uniref:CDP-alcohol phosphatidyltransferase family protein n=1 Tax=Nocardioides sp. YIM 152588 TaxID=3158259 RepID=UPI0032E425BF